MCACKRTVKAPGKYKCFKRERDMYLRSNRFYRRPRSRNTQKKKRKKKHQEQKNEKRKLVYLLNQSSETSLPNHDFNFQFQLNNTPFSVCYTHH